MCLYKRIYFFEYLSLRTKKNRARRLTINRIRKIDVKTGSKGVTGAALMTIAEAEVGAKVASFTAVLAKGGTGVTYLLNSVYKLIAVATAIRQ